MSRMEKRFDPARLAEWLRSVATTEQDEVDCDAIAAAAEQLLAAGARGDDLRAVLPHLALHLAHCPDCREWYETVLALVEEDAPS
jgi:hypothetical protein